MELNGHILANLKKYPTDGTFKYVWPMEKGYAGVTQDIVYDGELIAKANPNRETFCCGIVFENWLYAALDAGMTFNAELLRQIRREFFIATKESNPKGCVYALSTRGLGAEVVKEEAKAGDLAQIWRENGSGHTVTLTDRIISNVDYWSTQKSGFTSRIYATPNNGIGYRREYFDRGYSPIKDIYIVRAYSNV